MEPHFGNPLGGAAVTETAFSHPGLGKLMDDANYVHDFPRVQASVLLLATTYVVVNLTVDILYMFIDPRIRCGVKFKGGLRFGTPLNHSTGAL